MRTITDAKRLAQGKRPLPLGVKIGTGKRGESELVDGCFLLEPLAFHLERLSVLPELLFDHGIIESSIQQPPENPSYTFPHLVPFSLVLKVSATIQQDAFPPKKWQLSFLKTETPPLSLTRMKLDLDATN